MAGFHYATITIPDEAAAQCEQALKNIATTLPEAGASMQDIVCAW